MTDPHAPRVDGDRLLRPRRLRHEGRPRRGAARGLPRGGRRGLAGDVVVAAVRRRGARQPRRAGGRCAARCAADAAIVTEPTELELRRRPQGLRVGEIEVTRPRRARLAARTSASTRSSRRAPVLTALGALDAALGDRARTRCSAAARSTPRSIEGGAELSSYPARCALGLERRTLPGETAADDRGRDRRRCSTAAAPREPALDASARTLLVREPFEVDPDAEIVARRPRRRRRR